MAVPPKITLLAMLGVGLGIAYMSRRKRPKRPLLNKDTQICISLAKRPSNIGTRFHNYLYEELGIDFIYKACTTSDIKAAIGGVRALGLRGCSVSMPFKEAVIALVDEMDASALAIQSVNTIVNTGGTLRAYNTDYGAIVALIASHGLRSSESVAIRGSGGMAKAVGAAFRDAGFMKGTVIARDTTSGPALAAELGYVWTASVDGIAAEILVNVTPIGMAGSPEESEIAFRDDAIERARVIFDVVAFPSETPLVRRARAFGKALVTGAEVIALQAAKQFELYTGVQPTKEQVLRASVFSRSCP